MIDWMLTDRHRLPRRSPAVADMVAGRRPEIDITGLTLDTRD